VTTHAYLAHSIVKALDKLNIYKYPVPDGLHPRIPCETRNVILTPLRIIFETSLHIKQLSKIELMQLFVQYPKKETS